MKDNYFIILFWICVFWVCMIVIIVSDRIDTLNDNTELLINKTDTILTILQNQK